MRRSYKPRARLMLPWERELRPLRRSGWARSAGSLLAVAALSLLTFEALGQDDKRAELRVTRAMLSDVERATRAFVSELGRCPEDLAELVHPPKSGRQFLRELPLDAWQQPPLLRCIEAQQSEIEAQRSEIEAQRSEIEVVSAGPSGSFFDDDNVM
jgi:hypothetical protein